MTKERTKDFCIHCRKETVYTLQRDTITKSIRGKEYTFQIRSAICSECGEWMDIPELEDENMEQIDLQYRQMEQLVTKEDIQKLMTLYNIGKAPLSLALGFGEITVTRYLDGQIPSREYSDIIKKALASPEFMILLLNENAEKLGPAAYKKAMEAAKEMTRLFSVSEKMLITISYLFEQMQEVTPLALQKMLYFTQGIYSVLFDKPLYEEDCQAWVHGPVYEDVFNMFRNFKYNPIEDHRFAVFKGRFSELTRQEKMVLDLVINSFGLYSGKILEKITHNEKPWKDARNGLDPLEPSKAIITKESIKEYFSEISKTYGIDSADKLNIYIQTCLSDSHV